MGLLPVLMFVALHKCCFLASFPRPHSSHSRSVLHFSSSLPIDLSLFTCCCFLSTEILPFSSIHSFTLQNLIPPCYFYFINSIVNLRSESFPCSPAVLFCFSTRYVGYSESHINACGGLLEVRAVQDLHSVLKGNQHPSRQSTATQKHKCLHFRSAHSCVQWFRPPANLVQKRLIKLQFLGLWISHITRGEAEQDSRRALERLWAKVDDWIDELEIAGRNQIDFEE